MYGVTDFVLMRRAPRYFEQNSHSGIKLLGMKNDKEKADEGKDTDGRGGRGFEL